MFLSIVERKAVFATLSLVCLRTVLRALNVDVYEARDFDRCGPSTRVQIYSSRRAYKTLHTSALR